MKYIITIFFLLTLLSCNIRLNNFRISGSSMSPNLNSGDVVKVDKQNKNLDYGDIIVCYQKGEEWDEYEYVIVISRIVGLPRDSIKVKHDICIINGIENKHRLKQRSKMVEYEVHYDEYEEIFPNGKSILIFHSPLSERDEDITETIKIPEDHFFIMGDNRSNSVDSRRAGTIHRSKIIGKVIKITPAE